MSTSVERLARKIARLEKQVRDNASAPRLRYSSMDGGSLIVKDDDGATKMIVGQQYDGTNTTTVVNSPIPPTPSIPIADGVTEGIRIRWDGLFADGSVAPMDFARVEVHVSLSNGFSADTAATLKGTFESPRGSEMFVPLLSPLATHYIKFVTRTQGGSRSLDSAQDDAVPLVLPAGADTLAPAGVGTVTPSTAVFTDAVGVVRASVTLDWPDVTTNTDATPLTDLNGYEVWRKRSADSTWQQIRTVDASIMTDQPYERNEAWQFKVRAVDKVGNAGPFSAVASITTANDNTNPPTPSQPGASSDLKGGLRVTWDGRDSTAAVMPADFAYVEVHVSTNTNFTPTSATLVGRLTGPGALQLAGYTVGQIRGVRLVSVDTSGNGSLTDDVPGTPSARRDVTIGGGTDGVAPTLSGGITVALRQFGIAALEASWSATVTSLDPVTYDVYITQGAAVSVFNSTTLVGSQEGTSMVIRGLPNGTALLPDTDYYVAVRVRDADAQNTATTGTAGPTQYRKATNTEISSTYGYFGTVQAEQIQGDFLKAKLAIIGSLTIGAAGSERQISLTPDGLVAKDASGNLAASIPTDTTKPVSFNADVEAKSLTVVGRAAFRKALDTDGVTIVPHELAQGALFSLRRGVTAPSQPVTVIQDGPFQFQPDTGTVPLSPSGLAYSTATVNDAWLDPSSPSSTLVTYQYADSNNNQYSSVVDVNSATGVATAVRVTEGWNASVLLKGAVRIGGNYYVLTDKGFILPDLYIRKYNSAGVFQSEWRGPTNWRLGPITRGTVITTDGTNLLVGYADYNDSFKGKVTGYDPTTGAVTVPTVTFASLVFATDAVQMTDLWIGTADLGAPAYMVSYYNSTTGQALSVGYTTGGVRMTDYDWAPAAGQVPVGVYWDGLSSWYVMDKASRAAYKYDGAYYTTGMNRQTYVTATWYNNGLGYETLQGVSASLLHKKRWNIVISGAAIPDGANAMRIYLGTTAGAVRTTQFRLASSGVIGVTSWRVTGALPTTNNPPSSNTFPNSTPAKITDDSGTYYFDGSGDSKLNNLDTNTLDVLGPQTVSGTSTLASLQVTGAGDVDGNFNVDGLFTSPRARQSGSVAVSTGAANTVSTTNVVFATAFPVGVVPAINVDMLLASSTAAVRVECWVSARSNTGFTVQVNRVDAALSGTVMWRAETPTQ